MILKTQRRRHPARTTLAIHEAGHAVMACVLDLPIERVTIRPRPEFIGACILDEAAGTLGRTNLLLSIAGDVACAIHRPDDPDYLAKHSSTFRVPAGPARRGLTDVNFIGIELANADRIVGTWIQKVRNGTVGDEPPPPPMTRAQTTKAAMPYIEEAWRTLDKHWQAVESIALELLTLDTVDGARVQDLFRAAGRFRNPRISSASAAGTNGFRNPRIGRVG